MYEELRELGAAAYPALARAIRDPDVHMRKNVTLALGTLSGTWWDRTKTPLRITPLLPDLILALEDEDFLVRNWSAQAIGNMRGDAAPAVPALGELLAREEQSRISVCNALRRIGPAARDALRAC